MEVILLERVEKLGAIGDVVKVKDGFARNFLLPRKKALRANEANRKLFEANRAKIEADNADRRKEAEKAAKDVDGKSVQLIRQASNTGQLYGSVSARDIVEALEAEGAHVTKSQVTLSRPMRVNSSGITVSSPVTGVPTMFTTYCVEAPVATSTTRKIPICEATLAFTRMSAKASPSWSVRVVQVEPPGPSVPLGSTTLPPGWFTKNIGPRTISKRYSRLP